MRIKISQKTIEILRDGGIGILPTDTLYGLVGLALNKKTVARMYQLKNRNLKKPMIVLIADLNELKLFQVKIEKQTQRTLKGYWPGKVSVILPCFAQNLFYLHRGTKTLAFRLPKEKWLVNLLKKTGPLAAPSANPEGMPPAQNIKEAKRYFNHKVDFYIQGGELKGSSSTLIEIKGRDVIIKRKGALRIKKRVYRGQTSF